MTLYKHNGTGRDSYIAEDNGGFSPMKGGDVSIHAESHFRQTLRSSDSMKSYDSSRDRPARRLSVIDKASFRQWMKG